MTIKAFRNSLLGLLGMSAAAFLLGSCGGGGATSSVTSQQGGPIELLPLTGSAYAGVPFTMTMVGGRPPYTITSSEPSLFPVPNLVQGNSFTTIPANPGVIDSGLKPEDLPIRTVNVTMRDATAQPSATAVIKVGINFLTGYGVSVSGVLCPGNSATTTISACAGGESLLTMRAEFQGNLYGDRKYRFDVIRGNFALRDPVTGQVSSSLVTTSDHAGNITALIDVNTGAPSQIAIVRVTDVGTGVYADNAFTIAAAAVNATTLTAIPGTISFTGTLTTDCGTGAADILVFDGTPPYTAVALNPNTQVTPSTSNANPGRFTITANNRSICLDAVPVVVTDSSGGRVTVTVTTKPGTGAPPVVSPFTVSPNTVTLACGATGTVSVAGGSGIYTANSNHPRVLAFTFGNSVGISRLNGDGATAFPLTALVSVTDGTNIQTVTVNVPANCP